MAMNRTHFDGGIDIRFVGGARDGLYGCDRNPPQTVTQVVPGGPAEVYQQVDVDPDGTLVYRKK